MANPIVYQPDPKLDLLLERTVDVPRELVWKAWTTPEYLKKWFTPAPWKTVDCEIDLRPGGIFRTVMQSPEGQTFPNVGCYLEVVGNERLIWTNAMLPGYRPNESAAACPGDEFYFTCVLSLEREGNGTRYSALVMHADEASRKKHEAMGFHHGWGAALDQLIAVIAQAGVRS
ncbi:MAG: SRPBCC family protein [Terriglobia bacterium]